MSTNKYLIVTRADENISEMTDITHPIIKKYAERVGADFYVLNKPSPCPDGKHRHHYRIFECKELLDKYDRILNLDSDILILPDCPDIFKLVPEDHIGSIYEDVGSRKEHRRALIKKVQLHWGTVGWTSGYINTGIFICSKQHKEIFNTEQNDFWIDFGYDDIHLAYKAHKVGFPIYELPYKFNHMTIFSEPWNNNLSRFTSYIIHYAGAGIFETKFSNRLEQIKNDYEIVYE